MNQRARDVSFLDGSVQLLPLSAPHTSHEIGEMIFPRMTAGTGPLVASHPALIAEGVFVARGEVPVRSVKDGADGITAIEQTAADAGFIVRDPMPNFELHHLASAIRLIEFEDAVERVRRFLIVIEHEMAAGRGDAGREGDAESPPCVIHLMDPLVPEVPVSCIPDPMPVVMKAISRERFQRGGTGPEVVVDTRGNGFGTRAANRVAPLEA